MTRDDVITKEECQQVALHGGYTGATLYWLAAHINHEHLVRAMHKRKPEVNINAKASGSLAAKVEFFGNVFSQALHHQNWALASDMLHISGELIWKRGLKVKKT